MSSTSSPYATPQSLTDHNITLRRLAGLPSDILSQRSRQQPSPVHPIDHPQPVPQAPAPDSRTVVDRDPYAAQARASDTLTGATSGDVHGGIGRPGAGMSSAERHHDGQAHRKRDRQGMDQYGRGEIPRDEEDLIEL